MLSLKDTTRMRSLLLRWYRSTAREFPWRVAGVDPYIVFVSEIMLQQTQASRVAELLPPFLDRFPGFRVLAEATNAEVIVAWKGLGYNSRALRLRNAARAIITDHGGVLPREVDVLRTLPGIGPYASAAISTFAFNTYTVVLDVNVRRVYSRLHARQLDTTAILPDTAIRLFGYSITPKRNASEWHHAVMDLGATICKARTALCSACPLKTMCPSYGITVPDGSTTARHTKPSREPLFRGEPRRLWRGRIIQALREHHPLPVEALISMVFGPTTPAEDESIERLIAALTADGLIYSNSNVLTL